MKAHLAKLGLFLAIQLGLWSLLRCVPDATPGDISSHAPGLSGDERLAAYLAEQLYPYWMVWPGAIDTFAAAPPDDHVVNAVAEAYLNGPDDYLAALIDKAELLRSSPSPRMIFAGGSGLAFGLDSAFIAERYGYTPVNLGLHIGLGPEFILNLVQDHVREGDVIVLCFEHDGLIAPFETTPDRRAAICRLSPQFRRYFDGRNDSSASIGSKLASAKRYADRDALSDLAGEVRRRATAVAGQVFASHSSESRRDFETAFALRHDELLAAVYQSRAARGRVVYQRSSFNSYGDLTGHWKLPMHSEPKMLEPRELPVPLGLEQQQQVIENLDRLNQFAAEYERRGARVLFCATPLLDRLTAEGFALCLSDLIDEHLTIPILAKPEEMIYGRELFYDTPNHLNWVGTCRRMAMLAERLDRHTAPVSDATIESQIAARDRAIRGPQRVALNQDSTTLE